MTKTIFIVAGPTASGKSARAIELAQENNGVIINADSMQIYNALPLLSAQPSAEDIKAAPHLLYGHLHPNQDCSAGAWQRMAKPLIESTLAEGRTPIICGGTGLYIKALTNGLSPIPETPSEIRAATSALMQEIGCAALHAKLEARDPLIKGRFHPNHSARIMRAWEVLEATGKSIITWQAEPLIAPPADWNFKTEIILPDRETLYASCEKRFDWMLNNGALEEVKAFASRMIEENIAETALITNALGFKPLRAYLAKETTLEAATKQAKQDTRNYAKRQSTWFKNQF